jgi:hypothetical protein
MDDQISGALVMRRRGEWAESYWDVIAMAMAFAIALGLGALLGVGYNVLASWLEPPAVEIEMGAPEPQPPVFTPTRATIPAVPS